MSDISHLANNSSAASTAMATSAIGESSMVRGVIGKVGLATVVVLAACSEPQEQSGLDPSFKVVSATACDPNVFNSLIAGYFPSGQQNGIVGLKNQLLAMPTTD